MARILASLCIVLLASPALAQTAPSGPAAAPDGPDAVIAAPAPRDPPLAPGSTPTPAPAATVAAPAPPAAAPPAPVPPAGQAPGPEALAVPPATTAAPSPAGPDLSRADRPCGRAVGCRRRRAPFYAQVGIGAGAIWEDKDNRLTSRPTRRLFSAGMLVRAGAIVRERHLLGLRLAMLGRPTRSLLIDGEAVDEWGGVGHVSVGPEYRYQLPEGLFFGGSLALNAIGAGRDDGEDWPSERGEEGCQDGVCEDVVDGRGALGIGVVGTVGYELRVAPWLGLTAELYAGLYGGVDDDERDMDTASFGIQFGAGI